jgi:hypothetical protein
MPEPDLKSAPSSVARTAAAAVEMEEALVVQTTDENPTDEPASFAPPESATELAIATDSEQQPPTSEEQAAQKPPAEPRHVVADERSSSPYDGPVEAAEHPAQPTRAQGRLAQALRNSPASQRPSAPRHSESDDGQVVFEFDRLGSTPVAATRPRVPSRAPMRRHPAAREKAWLTDPELAPAEFAEPQYDEHESAPMYGPELGGYVEYEATCGMGEPNCAVYEPSCEVYDSCCDGPTCACECGDPGCAGDCDMCEIVSLSVPRPKELTFFGGVHGFKGPLDGPAGNNRDRGNFGIHEGFNWGGCYPWWGKGQVGYQIGYQLVHSQLSGSTTTPGGPATSEAHTQQFLTAGLFRRCQGPGWQYGAVWDMLRDERSGSVDFQQIRAEIGLIGNSGRELGFSTAVHVNDTSATNVNYRTIDQYLLYYRIHAPNGGEARVIGGFNENHEGILGANFLIPMHDRWSLASGITYLIPDGSGATGAAEESWNLSMSLVWHMGCRARSCHGSIYRPLFDVADNGSLIVGNRP